MEFVLVVRGDRGAVVGLAGNPIRVTPRFAGNPVPRSVGIAPDAGAIHVLIATQPPRSMREISENEVILFLRGDRCEVSRYSLISPRRCRRHSLVPGHKTGNQFVIVPA